MSNLDYLIIVIASSITILFELESYSIISGNRFNINTKRILLVILFGILVTINTYTYYNFTRIFTNFLLLFILNYIIFKESFNKTLLLTLFYYLIATFLDILLSALLLLFKLNSYNFDNSAVIKMLFSFLSSSLTFLTCSLKINRKILSSLNKKIVGNKILFIFLVIAFLSMIFIDFKYAKTTSKEVYFGNVIILICVGILLSTTIYNYVKYNNEMDKTGVLLNFMSRYEKIIDENRINKHEMLNNLLALKSFEDKNSKEFNDTLNDIILSYNNKSIGFNNFYKLPSGIKGIFYYKLNGLDEKGFNINIKVSKNISSFFKNYSYKNYLSVYKIVGILLDNAIEAAQRSKKKLINIDICKENNMIIIIISNSFNGSIDITKIKEKNYSSKGKNRGLGLYIVNNLIKNNTNIYLNQYIENDIFNSKLEIKK